MTTNYTNHLIRHALLAISMALLTSSALADKPSWADNGKHKEGKEQHGKKGGKAQGRDDDRDATISFRFGADDRRIVSDYYGDQARHGKCPPGLAKKNNGCLPPGQAKKWQRGQQLRDVKYYELPRELTVRLPVPPPNHRYVQVAGDILLIAVGTSMVVDAIEDILR